MGRELKRVALDFKWPIKKIWPGYLNPWSQFRCNCPECDGSGLNPATNKLNDDWYASDNYDWEYHPDGNRRYNKNAWQYQLTEVEVAALVEHGRLMDLTHTWNRETGWKKKEPAYIPTPAEVNEWAKDGMGHDSLNRWVCVEARAKHLGIYGKCDSCGGKGEIWALPQMERKADRWRNIDPPAGEGYQLWGTTSEGEPLSPVFETLEELCKYLDENKVSVFGRDTLTAVQWFNMLSEDKSVVYKDPNMPGVLWI